MIQSKPSNKQYRDGWDRVFKKKEMVSLCYSCKYELLASTTQCKLHSYVCTEKQNVFECGEYRRIKK